MRRKTEKAKTPKATEKERPKRRSTRNRKHSSSSDSDEPTVTKKEVEVTESEVVDQPVPDLQNVSEEAQNEDKQDQVWQVKSSDASDDGEIKKLKICLTTRPPSTPERPEQSPHKKKHRNRSDTTSSEGGSEEKRKSHRHKGKKSVQDIRDEDEEVDKNNESEDKGNELESEEHSNEPEKNCEVSTTIATLEGDKGSKTNENTIEDHVETTEKVNEDENEAKECDSKMNESDKSECQQSNNDDDKLVTSQGESVNEKAKNESKNENKENLNEKKKVIETHNKKEDEKMSKCPKTSEIVEEKTTHGQGLGDESPPNDTLEINHKEDTLDIEEKIGDTQLNQKTNELELEKEEPPLVPIIVSRKRRWGTKTSATSKNIVNISTDSLKNLIADPIKPSEFSEVLEEKQIQREYKSKNQDLIKKPILPKIVIDNTNHGSVKTEDDNQKDSVGAHRKISIMHDEPRPPSPSKNKSSSVLYITNLVRPFTLTQLKNLLQRTGKIVAEGFWIDSIKSKCYVHYENEDQAIETRHALHGVTWPVSNPKSLNVEFSTVEALEHAKTSEAQVSTDQSKSVGTVEDWLREQDAKRDRFIEKDEKPWERKGVQREWDVGKGEKDKGGKHDRFPERRRRSTELSPEPMRKFKKKEEEAPAKLLDDLFRKTKTTPCIYWLPLSEETIAIKEEQRRKHMEEHERRMQEMRHRRRY